MSTAFESSAPGRLCLFGEHQDYLGLPVVAMAMNRRCHLRFNPRHDMMVEVHSEALGHVGSYDLQNATAIEASAPMGVALREIMGEGQGQPANGWDVTITSEIPIRAGCSSSTAMLTAWVAAWLHILRGGYNVEDVVERCHRYEVLRFQGAGGNMDQFACAHGGLHRFGNGRPQALQLPEGTFVLGDSGQPKDTQGHLRRCKEARLPLMPFLDEEMHGLDGDEKLLLEGTKTNRDLEDHWAHVMQEKRASGREFGEGLTQHHAVLRDVLGLSTPRIESMLSAAYTAGAYGGKINGSGGGGCAFVLTPPAAARAVCDAMLHAGAAGAWPVSMENGVQCA